ncbi:MAG: peptidase U32 family protein, partial [Planctomycetota bacterium]
MNEPELLAPVSGPDGLRPALAAGADAVYLGLKEFNARRKAQNFTPDELTIAVQDCRRARCRVYLTFNTLVYDDEWRRALKALAEAYEAGVDALIIQDPGVARAVKQWLPDLPLHASTQMTVHHPSQLAPLAGLGIERVILARELTLEEVKAMAETARGLGIEVEVFAHGALCVSYSGQCLISALMEGRSGNRGLCAQLCRRPFQIGTARKMGKKSLPLSMKDLSALPLLHDLVHTGVAGLKVEGRLKRPEYVAGVVRVYKEALSRIAACQEGPFHDLESQLDLVYNRGFSLGGLGDEFSAKETTGKWGGPRFLEIGRVVEVDRDRERLLLMEMSNPPEPGDGVALFPEEGGPPSAFVVTKVFPPQEKGTWIGVKPFEGTMQNCPDRG